MKLVVFLNLQHQFWDKLQQILLFIYCLLLFSFFKLFISGFFSFLNARLVIFLNRCWSDDLISEKKEIPSHPGQSQTPPLSLPIQIMLLPLSKRFRYHFTGNRQTNNLTKVRDYTFTVIQTKISFLLYFVKQTNTKSCVNMQATEK